MANIPCCAVAIVGECADHHGDTAGTISFVDNLFETVAVVGAGGFLDAALDVVIGHIGGFRLGNDIFEPAVAFRISSAILDCDLDFTAKLGENCTALGIRFTFFAFDVVPFGMAGHVNSPHLVSVWPAVCLPAQVFWRSYYTSLAPFFASQGVWSTGM